MKKFLYSILAVATLAGCANNEIDEAVPSEDTIVNEPVPVYVEVGAAAGIQTKASFDGELAAYWEAGDQILAVQGLSTTDERRNNISFTWTDVPATASTMELVSGDGTPNARFAGEVNDYIDGSASYIHFAYPAAGASLSTNVSLDFNTINVSDRKATTTCSFTVPASQDGKWTPAMFATTPAAIALGASVGDITFTNVNSCLAVRVFEKDGTTPKQIESVTITAANNFVGTISATTPVSKNGNPLTADIFASSATGNTITATNLGGIAALGGNYEYRFEVLPVDAGSINIEIVDAAGSVVTRTVNLGKAFEANKRHGVKVTWDPASITMNNATSWYEDYAGNAATALSPGAVYANGIKITGVAASEVKEVGLKINGTNNAVSTDWSAMRNIELSKAGLASGKYDVQAYAILSDNTEIATDVKSIEVMGAGVTANNQVYSSYSVNGVDTPNNSLNGSRIYADMTTNDAYVNENLVNATTIYYGDTSASAAGVKAETGNAAWASYNSHATLTLKNGYTLSSPAYTTHVTGIPFEADWSKNNYAASEDGWKYHSSSDAGEYLTIGSKTKGGFVTPAFNVPTDINLNIQVAGGCSAVLAGNTAWYVSAVSSNASLNMSEKTMAMNKTLTNTSYATFNAHDVQFTTTNNRLSVAAYGGTTGSGIFLAGYEARIVKVKIEYK